MALQPRIKPSGSSLVLHFRGTLALSTVPFGTYPIANAEVPSDVVANTSVGVRFLLADATVPTDTSRRLANGVFDDAQPAGSSPRAPQSIVVPNVTTPTDAVVTLRTWAQNTYITLQPQTAADAALLVGVEADKAQVVLDGVDSGLGTNTGLPVIVLPLIFSVGAEQFTPVNIDMLVEVRHSAVR